MFFAQSLIPECALTGSTQPWIYISTLPPSGALVKVMSEFQFCLTYALESGSKGSRLPRPISQPPPGASKEPKLEHESLCLLGTAQVFPFPVNKTALLSQVSFKPFSFPHLVEGTWHNLLK